LLQQSEAAQAIAFVVVGAGFVERLRSDAAIDDGVAARDGVLAGIGRAVAGRLAVHGAGCARMAVGGAVAPRRGISGGESVVFQAGAAHLILAKDDGQGRVSSVSHAPIWIC